jgi:hypothetical protein
MGGGGAAAAVMGGGAGVMGGNAWYAWVKAGGRPRKLPGWFGRGRGAGGGARS